MGDIYSNSIRLNNTYASVEDNNVVFSNYKREGFGSCREVTILVTTDMESVGIYVDLCGIRHKLVDGINKTNANKTELVEIANTFYTSLEELDRTGKEEKDVIILKLDIIPPEEIQYLDKEINIKLFKTIGIKTIHFQENKFNYSSSRSDLLKKKLISTIREDLVAKV